MQPTQRVLVVDSDPESLESTTSLLSDKGFEVLSAGGAQQVLQMLASRAPQVIVIEPELDGLDGFELCRSILASSRDPAPVVFLASRKLSGKEPHLRAKDAGAQLFLERPAKDKFLVMAVEKALTGTPGAAPSHPGLEPPRGRPLADLSKSIDAVQAAQVAPPEAQPAGAEPGQPAAAPKQAAPRPARPPQPATVAKGATPPAAAGAAPTAPARTMPPAARSAHRAPATISVPKPVAKSGPGLASAGARPRSLVPWLFGGGTLAALLLLGFLLGWFGGGDPGTGRDEPATSHGLGASPRSPANEGPRRDYVPMGPTLAQARDPSVTLSLDDRGRSVIESVAAETPLDSPPVVATGEPAASKPEALSKPAARRADVGRVERPRGGEARTESREGETARAAAVDKARSQAPAPRARQPQPQPRPRPAEPKPSSRAGTSAPGPAPRTASPPPQSRPAQPERTTPEPQRPKPADWSWADLRAEPETATPPVSEPATTRAQPARTRTVRAEPPRLIESSRVEPRYPLRARSSHAGGRVVLRVLVRDDGTVGDIEILEESPAGMGFAHAAETAVRRWRYKPARRDGQRVESTTRVTLVFQQ